MSSINPQIDAAVVLMKARAAEFDDRREMTERDTSRDLTSRAEYNLGRAGRILFDAAWMRADKPTEPSDAVVHLVDTMNLCALALSVLPKGKS